MKKLFSESEFENCSSRALLNLECKHCRKPFKCQKRYILRALNKGGRHKHDYCSHTCQRKHQHPLVAVECSQCQKSFEKPSSQAKRSKSGNQFCSRSCAAKWNNAHKKHGTRRSKLEVWLEEQLPIVFPDLEFHFNRKDAINSELDIYIPSLNLAFELNGIFHYEPIYGSEKLSSIQNNDERKFQACIEAEIELCLIDVSSQKYFKPKSSYKFLNIVTSVVDSKISSVS